MRQVEDIAPLVDMATAEWNRLVLEVQRTVNDLDRFWTRLYGPNEATERIHDALRAMDAEFYNEDES